MKVIVHRIPANMSGRLAAGSVHVVGMRAADLENDNVSDLLAAVSADDDGPPPFAVRGLVADVRGRNGRFVRAWAAVRGDGTIQALVSLAEATVGGHRRFSIPWLVVDPRDRRRGVGEALVRVALAMAYEAGAEDVAVETLASWRAARAFWAEIAKATEAEDRRSDGCSGEAQS